MSTTRSFSGLWPAAALAAATALAAPAWAQGTGTAAPPGRGPVVPGSMGIPQPEPLITVNFTNRSLARALTEVFRAAPYKYQVLSGIPTTQFSLNVTRVPLTTALKQLLAQDKGQEPLVFSFVRNPAGGGTFVIDREYIELSESEGERRVSIANGRVTEALPRLFKLMKAKGRVEPDVPPVLISLQLRPDNWAQVLPQLIIEAAKQEPTLTYSTDRDEMVVHLHKTPAMGSPDSPARRVNLALNSAPLRDAMKTLFQGSGWRYEVADAVKDVQVTYTTSDEPELAALQQILRQVDQKGQQVTYREGRGVLYIEPGPLPGSVTVTTRPGTTTEKLVTLTAQQQSIRVIAETIGRVTGTSIRVAPNVPATLRVSVEFDKNTAQEALRKLIEAAKVSLPNITFRETGIDAYLITLGQANQ